MDSIWEEAYRELFQFSTVRESFWKNKPTWTVNQFVFLLNGLEPTHLDENSEVGRSDSETRAWMMLQELAKWREWVRGCPSISRDESSPMEVPIDKRELIKWASSLDSIELPEWISNLVSYPAEGIENTKAEPAKPQTLSSKKQNTYLSIIAALCKEADLNLEKPYASETNGVIAVRLRELEVELSENTIAATLKAAKSFVENSH